MTGPDRQPPRPAREGQGGPAAPPRAPRPARQAGGHTLYHGIALLHPRDAARLRRGGPGAGSPGAGGRRALARAARLGLALALVAGVAAAGWHWRAPATRALARLRPGRAPVAVSGLEYLSPAEVLKAAGLGPTEAFFKVDLERARRRLACQARVREARVERWLDGRVHITIVERVPAVLVPLGRLTEADGAGRLLPPLVGGVVADLPVVTGLAAPRGGWIREPGYARALRWVRALAAPEVGLGGRVSEVDVAAAAETRVVLSPSGVRVLLPDEPDDVEELSALRIVLADLAAKQQEPVLIDCRVRGQAVVRAVAQPAADGEGKATTAEGTKPDEEAAGAARDRAGPAKV